MGESPRSKGSVSRVTATKVFAVFGLFGFVLRKKILRRIFYFKVFNTKLPPRQLRAKDVEKKSRRKEEKKGAVFRVLARKKALVSLSAEES